VEISLSKTRRKRVGLRGRPGAVLLLTVVAVVLLWAPACLSQQTAVAKVNETVLTVRDLEEAFNKLIPAASFHGRLSDEKREAYRSRAVEQMITDELLFQEGERMALKVDRKEIKEARGKTIKRLGGKKHFKAALKQAGLTDSEYREKLRRNFLIEKTLKVEVTDKAQVSDDEARKHYDDNRAGFKRPEARRLRHVLISVAPNATGEEWETRKERAEEALRKIKDGEDMASVAWDYSDGPYRVKGGDLGLLHKGRLAAKLENAVVELKAGEISGIIQTIYGYHIVKVEEVKEPEQLEFEDVRQKIKRKIKARRSEELQDALSKRLRADAQIEVY
jgi:parvulin-like peptidyl-prolyl isomerase